MIESGVALSTAFYTSVGGMSFGFSFLVVRWFATFVAGRIDRKEANVDAGTQRLIERLEKQVDGLIEYKETVERKLKDCLERDIEKERRIAQLEGLAAGFGDARQHAQLIVASEKASSRKSGEDNG